MVKEDYKDLQDAELLKDLKSNIEDWYSYFGENVTLAKESKKFLYGSQWTDEEEREYQELGKVYLTFNKLYPYVKRLIGEIRAFTPDLKVTALKQIDGNVDAQALIKSRENILRGVSYSSRSAVAYQTAFKNALGGGFGAVRVTTEYENDTSFNQVILIDEVAEPEKCFWDPVAKDPFKASGKFCGSHVTLSFDEFKAKYGFEPDMSDSMDGFGGDAFSWGDDENITLVDIYVKEEKEIELLLMSDGETITRQEYNKINKGFGDVEAMDVEIQDTRKSSKTTIMNYKFINSMILEKNEWKSPFLPDVYVDGDSYYMDGKQYTQPFIKDAIDAQRFVNYVGSETAQNIKDANNEDYVVTPDNIKGNKKQWMDKRRRKGALVASPDPKNGYMPTKQPPSQINPQLIQHFSRAENDIKTSLGVFDANQGAGEADLSGIAELTRITQGNMSSFVYVDNLTRSISQVGRIVLSLISTVLTNTQQILGIDENGKQVFEHINTPQMGGDIGNDMAEGAFDIGVEASAPFAAQRQREMQNILAFANVFQEVRPAIPDLVASKLDSDLANELVVRSKMMLPPAVIAADKSNPQAAQQAQQQLQQQQQMQQMQAQMQQQMLQMKMQDDHIKALAAQMGGQANMMNAQTNRDGMMVKAQQDGQKMRADGVQTMVKMQTEQRKAQAEEVKAEMAVQQEIIKTVGMANKAIE